MTTAPPDLLACRAFLQVHTGLTPVSLGIVGDAQHGEAGYHVGNPPVNDYSVDESVRDMHPDGYASALDLGAAFPQFRTVTLALVRMAVAGDPRMRDLREIIYTPDGVSVHRWDRLGRRTSGDSSHLTHTHFSFFRDSNGRRANGDNFLAALDEVFRGGPPELALDGILGPLTISRWQEIMKTPVDGTITQPPGRSDLVAAVQRELNTLGAGLAVDGVGICQDGHTVYQTTRALQRYLGTPVDGVLSLPSSPCVAALQRRLNAGTF